MRVAYHQGYARRGPGFKLPQALLPPLNQVYLPSSCTQAHLSTALPICFQTVAVGHSPIPYTMENYSVSTFVWRAARFTSMGVPCRPAAIRCSGLVALALTAGLSPHGEVQAHQTRVIDSLVQFLIDGEAEITEIRGQAVKALCDLAVARLDEYPPLLTEKGKTLSRARKCSRSYRLHTVEVSQSTVLEAPLQRSSGGSSPWR